jgi:CRP-like cAMP-binding protein
LYLRRGKPGGLPQLQCLVLSTRFVVEVIVMAGANPEAILPDRPGDVPLVIEQMLCISLLARLSEDRREKLLDFPGSVRLRRYRQGEVICHQGAEDCTAFFILRPLDLLRIRDAVRVAAENASAVWADARHWLKQTVEELAPAPRRRLEDARAAEVALGRQRLQTIAEVRGLRQARTAVEDNLKASIQALVEAAKKTGDKGRIAFCNQLGIGDAARLYLQADVVQAEHPPLAAGLRELARLRAEVAAAEQSADYTEARKVEAFLRTAGPGEMSERADQIQASDPELAGWFRALAAASEGEPELFASVELTPLSHRPADHRRGWFDRLTQLIRRAPAERPPPAIPFDGPTDLDARTYQATLMEGEVFGEMACRNRLPRSATVVALRDGYLLEMLSNVLEQIDRDPGYKKEREEVYKRRVLELHLREMAIFGEMSDEEFAQVFAEVSRHLQLVEYPTGDLICDEHERSDCLFLIRTGLVQVKRNVSWLLRVYDVIDWPGLLAALRSASGPATELRRPLAAAVQTWLDNLNAATMSDADRQEVIHALNEVIRNRNLAQALETQERLTRPSVLAWVAELPPDRKDWSEQDWRRYGRRLLEAVLPSELVNARLPTGPEHVVSYRTRGEFIGEMGVLERRPRSATCVAYGQMSTKKVDGQVELVRVPAQVVEQLLERFPKLKASIEREMARRRGHPRHHPTALPRDQAEEGVFSPAASALGLIQGQRLMLIDLERCTRCNECVQACVDAHDDGRTRLFLTGPRFGQYLVPNTCRSCLDPVCMVQCPVRAIQRGDLKEMVIQNWCIQCGRCAEQCPYDSIQLYKDAEAETDRRKKGWPVVCDMCSSSRSQDPACVYACPHDAALRVDALADFPKP